MTQPPPNQPPHAPQMGEVQNGYQWNGQQWVALGELGGSGPASKPEKPWYKKWWAIAIGVILALGILGNLMEGDEQSAAPATTILRQPSCRRRLQPPPPR